MPDPYRWLEDASAPEVKAWMDAQDRYARAFLAALPARERLRARFAELVYIDALSPPTHEGRRWFYTRHPADKEKAILYYRDAEDGPDRLLLDPNTMSADGTVSLKGWWPSRDGRYVAYKVSKNNADHATMYVRDLATGQDLPADVIEGARYASASWTPDSKGFYYTWLPLDEKIPVADLPGHAEIRYHRLGTDPAKDEVVFPATKDPRKFVGAQVSRDGRWLLVYVWHGWNRSDVYVRDLRAPQSPLRPFVVGRDALYHVMPWKGAFYVHTNEGAPRYRVFRVDPARLRRDAWKEIVPESDATLEQMEILGGHLALVYLRNAASELLIHTLDGRRVRKVELPGLGTVSALTGQPEDDAAYYAFASFTVKPQIFRASIRTGASNVWATIDYPADLSDYVTEQVFYPSKDGTKVSMFLVHRKDLPRTGDHPTLLYGYGGFSVNMTPMFRPWIVAWLEQGGVFAMPNLRGGGEYGETWHRAGMLRNKQNVFDDVIAAAEWLVAEKITRPEKLALSGRSNGGLLVGAAMTQRPDLFRAVVCGVPLLDMVRYHLFGSGKTWIEEYGSADDPELFPALFAYSPYHRVKEKTAYPALLMTSADTDDRVDPMHARKFVAAIQNATTSDAPVLLRIEKNAGHGGADLRRQQVEEWADVQAFLMERLGMAPLPRVSARPRRPPAGAPRATRARPRGRRPRRPRAVRTGRRRS